MSEERGMKKPREQKRASDEAVKEKSGKTWEEWFKILDRAGAKEWEHKQISSYLFEKQKVSPWWSQMISVGYERERGIRQQFQKCDGEFSASGSRTVNVPLAKLYEAWADEKQRKKWLPGVDMEVTTTKGKYFRAKWDGGKSRLSVGFYARGPQKSQVAVDHEKLGNAKECAKMKAYWFEVLNRLQAAVES
jgi:hypothetical protein